MEEIDSLAIGIEAEAGGAASAIDALCEKLSSLSGALSALGKGDAMSGLRNVASSFRSISESMKGIDEGKIGSIAKSLASLSKSVKSASDAMGSGDLFSALSKSAGEVNRSLNRELSAAMKSFASEFDMGRGGLRAVRDATVEWNESDHGNDALSAFAHSLRKAVDDFGKVNTDLDGDAAEFLDTMRSLRQGASSIYINPNTVKEFGDEWRRASQAMRGVFDTKNPRASYDPVTFYNELSEAQKSYVAAAYRAQTGSKATAESLWHESEIARALVAAYDQARGSVVSFSDALKSGKASEEAAWDAVIPAVGRIDELLKKIGQAQGGFKAVGDAVGGANVPRDSAFPEIAKALRSLQGLEIPDFGGLKPLAPLMKSLGDAMGSDFAGGLASFREAVVALKGLGEVRVPGLIETVDSITRMGDQAMSTAADNLGIVKHALDGLSGAEVLPVQGLEALAASFSDFASDMVTTAAANLRTLADSLGMLSMNMNLGGLAGLEPFVRGLRELSSIDVNGASEALRTLMENVSKMGDKAIPDFSNLEPLSQMLRSTASLIRANTAEAKANAPAIRSMAGSFSVLNGVGKVSTSVINKVTVSIRNLGKQVGGAFSGLRNFSRSLSRMYVAARSLRWALEILAKPIDIASQLTEVQNVVDTAFGQYSQKVEDLSKHSIADFGISELQVKKSAGTFQAMANSMGLAKDAASDMSVELVKLSADVASFYDADYSKVAEDMQSIYTGLSRPLRKYGLDLTQTTLQEYANAQGIQKKVSAMTQAEKTMLRYQYVLANTADAQGDFARTSNSWANQIRILKNNFQQLGKIIGTGFINFLKPAVQAFNRAFNQIIALAEKALNAIGKLLGWQVQISQVGVLDDAADSVGDYGDAMDDAAGGAKKAADEQEKLNENLAKFDKLNVITTPKDDAGGGGGGGGGGGAGGGGSSKGRASGGEVRFMPYESDVESWLDFGDRLNRALKNFLESIPWEEIQTKARQLGHALASILNGFNLDSETFYLLGQAIAQVLNTIAEAMDAFFKHINSFKIGFNLGQIVNGFFESIDWGVIHSLAKNMGEKFAEAVNGAFGSIKWDKVGDGIAEGLNAAVELALTAGKTLNFERIGRSFATAFNAFFAKFKWGDLGAAINTWVTGLLDAMITFIQRASWDKVGRSIGEMLAKINFREVLGKVGKLIVEALSAAVEMWANMFNVAPFETALLTIAAAFKLIGIEKIVSGFRGLGESLSTYSAELAAGATKTQAFAAAFPALGAVINAFKTVLGAAQAAGTAFFNEMLKGGFTITSAFNGIAAAGNAFFSQFSAGVAVILKAVGGVVAGIAEFAIVSDLFHDAYMGTVELDAGLAQLVVTLTAVGAALTFITGSTGIGLLVTAGIAAVAAIKGISDAAKEVAELEAWNAIGAALSQPGGVPLEEISRRYENAMFQIQNGVDNIAIASENLGASRDNVGLLTDKVEAYGLVIENAATLTEGSAESMANALQQLLNETIRIMEQEYQVILMGVSGAVKAGNKKVEADSVSFISTITGIKEEVVAGFETAQAQLDRLNKLYDEGGISAQEYGQMQLAIWQNSGLPDYINNAGTAVSKFADDLGGVDFSNFVTEANGMFEINWDGLSAEWGRIGQAAHETTQTVEEAAEGFDTAAGDYQNGAERLYGAQSEQVESVSKMRADMSGHYDGMIEDVRAYTNDYVNIFQTGLADKMEDIYTEAESRGQDGVAAVKKCVEDIKAHEDELRSDAREMGSDAKIWIGEFGDTLVEELDKGGQLVYDAVSNTYSYVDTAFTDAYQNAKDKYPEYGREIGKALPEGAVESMEAGKAEMDSAEIDMWLGDKEGSLAAVLEEKKAKAEQWARETGHAAAIGFDKSKETITEYIDRLLQMSGKKFEDDTATKDAAQGSAESIGDEFNNGLDHAKEKIDGKVDEAKEHIKSKVGEISPELAESISSNAAATDAAAQKGEEIPKAEADSITENAPLITEAVTTAEEGAMSEAAGANAEAYSEHGAAMVDSITNGINSETEKALPASLEALNATLTEGLNAIMGLEAMYPVGQNMMQGIINGFNESIELFNEALTAWWENSVMPWFSIEKWQELAPTLQEGLLGAWNLVAEQWNINMQAWWDASVLPWFSVEKWTEVSVGMQEGLTTALTNFSQYWNEQMQGWWDASVMPWFAADKWAPLGDGLLEAARIIAENVTTEVSDAMDDISDDVGDAIKDMTEDWTAAMEDWWKDGVEEFFDEGKWQDMAENFRRAVSDAQEQMIDEWDSNMDRWWDKTEDYFDGGRWQGMLKVVPDEFEDAFREAYDTVSEIMDRITEYVKKKCQEMADAIREVAAAASSVGAGGGGGGGKSGGGKKFASGGYPTTGQIFYARESGPELVGTIGNRTAVANNDQIVSAVAQGVAAAVSGVLNNGGGGSTELTINLDGHAVYKSVVRHDRQFRQSTGQSAFAY